MRKAPACLVVHEWWGLNDYARKRASMLAEMGYVPFALDMYGDNKVTTHPAKAEEWSKPPRPMLKPGGSVPDGPRTPARERVDR